MAALGEFALLLVFGLDAEAVDVDECGESDSNEDVCGYKLRLVVPDVGP